MISRNLKVNNNIKIYDYELLENGFSKEDILAGKKVLSSKK